MGSHSRRRWWQHKPEPATDYRPAFSYRPPPIHRLPIVETWESSRTRR